MSSINQKQTTSAPKPKPPQKQATPSPSPNPSASPSIPSPSPETNKDQITIPEPSPQTSPKPSPEPETHTQTLKSQAGHDGFQASNGGGNTNADIRTGRNTFLITHGFLNFKLESIPGNADVQQAKLKVYQTQIIGDPYSIGIRVMIDHLDYGDSLENTDYSLASLSSSFATLSTNDSIGWREIDITDQVRNDLTNGRSRSQYRLHMATETIGGTATSDFAYFESGDNSKDTGNIPELIIKYQ